MVHCGWCGQQWKEIRESKFSRPARWKGGYVLTIVSKKLSNEIGAVVMQPARTS